MPYLTSVIMYTHYNHPPTSEGSVLPSLLHQSTSHCFIETMRMQGWEEGHKAPIDCPQDMFSFGRSESKATSLQGQGAGACTCPPDCLLQGHVGSTCDQLAPPILQKPTRMGVEIPDRICEYYFALPSTPRWPLGNSRPSTSPCPSPWLQYWNSRVSCHETYQLSLRYSRMHLWSNGWDSHGSIPEHQSHVAQASCPTASQCHPLLLNLSRGRWLFGCKAPKCLPSSFLHSSEDAQGLVSRMARFCYSPKTRRNGTP